MAKDSVFKWSRRIEVPLHLMAEVATFISDKGLEHKLTGADMDDEIVYLLVYYNRDDLEYINELSEFIDSDQGDDDEG